MMIQLILTTLLVLVALFVGLQQTTSRFVKFAVFAVIALGTYFVWVPEETNRIAVLLGVGRGADLRAYLWIVITLALIVFLYLKILRLSRKVTQLTRAIALSHPQAPEPPE